MNDDSRETIDWLVPKNEWERHRRFVESEYGSLDSYLGEIIEEAMIEYAGTDTDLEATERKLDEFLDRIGSSKKKQQHFALEASPVEAEDIETQEGVPALANQERVRVSVRVRPKLKVSFKKATLESDDPPGVELARACRQYWTNPRGERIREKVEASVDILDDLLDGGGAPAVSNSERKTARIASEFREKFDDERSMQFLDTHLVEVIEDVAGSSAPTIRRYRESVTDHLNVELHPQNSDLWITSKRANELVDTNLPRVCRVSAEHLSGEPKARARRVKLELGQRAAAEPSGTCSVKTDTVEIDLLDDAFCRATARSTMNDVADADGFRMSSSLGGRDYLKVDLGIVQDANPELFREIINYHELVNAPTENGTAGDAEPAGAGAD